LERIYAFDNALLENADTLASSIDNIEASIETDGLPAAIRHMVTLSEEANEALGRRKDVILELNASQ
jgi:hypothetical protein